MGNACCKTTIGLQPTSSSSTSGTVECELQSMTIGANRLREDSLDQDCEHLIDNNEIYKVTRSNRIKNSPKDELESSGYSSGTKATGSDIPIYDPNLSPQTPCDRRFEVWSNNTEDLQPLKSDDDSSRQSMFYHDSNNNGGSREECGLKQQEKDRILTHFTYLKSQLDAEFLLDYFIQEDVFTDDQAERIKLAGPRKDQVDQFLRMLLMSNTSSAYTVLMTSLDNIHCKHIQMVLESENKASCLPADKNVTMKKAHETLSKQRQLIVAQLEDPISIAEYFLVHREFSLDEYELIFNEKTRKGRAEKLLDTVSDRTHLQRGYIILSHALNEKGYGALKDRQEGQDETNVKDVDDGSAFYELVSHGNEAADSSPEVEEDDEICITLNVFARKNRQKRRKEKRIVSKANKYKIKVSVNNNLLCDTECLISGSKMGSIIIRIKGCRKGAIQRLFKGGTHEAVAKLLRTIFAHPDMSKEIYATGTQLKVRVELLPGQKTELKAQTTDPTEIITSNIAFLVEELDAVCFMYLDIFTNEEKEKILAARVASRLECTELMLKLLLNKSKEEQSKFIHELKERKRFVWNHISPTEATECFNDSVLTTSYKDFVENLSPTVIVRNCVERGILNKNVLSGGLFTGRQREQCAQIIVQETLLQNYMQRCDFMRILIASNQLPPHISLQLKESDTAVESPTSVSTVVRVIFEGTYCPAGKEERTMQWEASKTAKDNLGDDESGYQSMSFRRRRSPHRSSDITDWSEENSSEDYNSMNDLSTPDQVLQKTQEIKRTSTTETDKLLPMVSQLSPIAHHDMRSRIHRSWSLPPRHLPPLPGYNTPLESEEELQMNPPGHLNKQKQSTDTLPVSPFIHKKIQELETTKKYEAKPKELPQNYDYVTVIDCGCLPNK